jgi:hypothetical protein
LIGLCSTLGACADLGELTALARPAQQPSARRRGEAT